MFTWVSFLICLHLFRVVAASPVSTSPKCRFSALFTQDQILANPQPFISDLLYWEGKFHQNNVSYNAFNGMSYDGTLLDETTGLATAKHPFSAASKEVGKLPHNLKEMCYHVQ
jgi:hypothetical protein